ncbi:hypothetical protein BDB00DRAFT_777707 [Zychaea mexicana]|uniref:uncharacterized protein n=1 Tax=Zychaea mexicana TaxID=64656 RepID=UPI0022FF31D4|nr:uncharacterized protein BDB00DRAFT_777707 [Zychaea mexicana]KAI9467468.1 hypothetical protein BDB00DRAFT_777707 [Zychaea mexicana]
MTPTITKEQALCMIFYVEFNPTNMENLKDRIKNMTDIDICYETDSLHPFLLPLVKMYSEPYHYKKYTKTFETLEKIHHVDMQQKQEIHFSSDRQIVQFLNEVYLTTDLLNDRVYTKKLVSNKDILSHVWPYTTKFDDKLVLGFSKWCYSKNVAFTTVDYQCKAFENGQQQRELILILMFNNKIMKPTTFNS